MSFLYALHQSSAATMMMQIKNPFRNLTCLQRSQRKHPYYRKLQQSARQQRLCPTRLSRDPAIFSLCRCLPFIRQQTSCLNAQVSPCSPLCHSCIFLSVSVTLHYLEQTSAVKTGNDCEHKEAFEREEFVQEHRLVSKKGVLVVAAIQALETRCNALLGLPARFGVYVCPQCNNRRVPDKHYLNQGYRAAARLVSLL